MLVRQADLEDTPQSYLDRQATVAALATGPDSMPVEIEYTASEHETWAQAQAALEPVWDRYAARALRVARDDLGVPSDQIPQLSWVTERLSSLTGFRYASVPGTVSGLDFFGALGRKIFSSTQFIRWSGSSDYTPAPDVLHEVGGHAVSLAHPQLAELHRLAGLAATAAPAMLAEIASVFWYSVEFGVIASSDGWKAYGTGLLSSPGELGWFTGHAHIRPLTIAAMIATRYDINCYQPVLFGVD